MSLPEELISKFVQLTNDSKQTTDKSETTVYGEVVEDNGVNYVQLDGSDQLTPVTTTATITKGERVAVLIKNHTATVIGNITKPSARYSDIQDQVDTITELQIVVAKKVDTDDFVAEQARINTVVADNAVIRESLTVAEAELDTLQANYVEVDETLTANEADIENLKATKLDADVADAKYATIDNLSATDAEIYNLNATYSTFVETATKRLDAAEADIDNLDANKLSAEDADLKYATIIDLDTERARIDVLEADVADIDTLIFGSATGSVIQTSFANAVIAQLGNAQIKSAMIDNISASKITSGDIITNNVRVMSEDGKLVISDETIQISDSNRVRVQIGKDSTGDYSINIWDSDGNLMFSEGGITDNAIKEAIIRNDMVSDTANIAAHKLDIDSLFTEINGSSNTIKSTQIYLDDRNQTLDVAFESLLSEVNDLGDTVSSQGTAITTVQGQISSKVWKEDITTATSELETTTEELSSQYTELQQELNSVSITVASHASTLSNKADSTTVVEVSDRVSSLETNLDGFESTVSNTYATKTEVTKIQNGVDAAQLTADTAQKNLDNLEVGGRNLLLNSKVFRGSNIICAATISSEKYNDFNIRTYDAPSIETAYVDMITFTNLYAEKLGATYTLSFYAKGTDGAKLCTYFHGNTDYVRVAKIVQSTGASSTATDGASYWALTEDWQRYWVTWTLKDTGDISIMRHVLFRLWAGYTADICGVKLEKGDKATDWTPAPEDIDSDISTAQSAAEAAQAIANQNAVDMANIVTNFNSDIADLQTQIDGSITSWFYEGEPTSSNEPAVNWTTTDLKNVHLSDLYYDTITGYCYRYQVQNSAYSWQRITDTDVTKALSDAKTAQDTADQKRRVFYTQPTVPYDAGDLWVQGSNGDILRCQTAKVSGQTYSSSDWVVASKYTDDTVAKSAAQTAANAQQVATAAQEDINNLQIGGRNLLFKSRGDNITDWTYSGVTVIEDDTKEYCVERQNTTVKEVYIGTTRTATVEPSAEHTFSMDVWCNEYLTNFDIHWLSDTIDTHKTAAGYVNVLSKSMMTIIPNTWTRVSWTFTTNANDRTGYFRIDNNATNEEGTASIVRVANLKFEKGNRATDWTPAPEDLEERVSTAETKIIQNGESISSLATRTTVVENKFAGYSTTEAMNSAIEQSAEGIQTSVSETYTTKTEFNNLTVGGRNLVAGTDEIREYVGNINSSGASSTYKDVWTAKTIDIPTDTEYIVSFDAKADVAQNITCYFYSPNTTLTAVSSTGQSRSSAADGGCQVSITTEWTRYWVKWTQTPADSQKSIIIGRNFTENDIYIRAVKFEVGNTPTDWTPAPEDMATSDDVALVQSSSDLIEERVSTAESLIEQLSDSLAVLITDENGESLMTQTSDGWTFSTANIQDTVNATSENLDKLTNEVGDVNSTVNALQQAVDDLGVLNKYVKIGTYEDEPCIELDKNDSDFKLIITNTRIMFMEGSGVPAYINNQSLFIKKAVIEEELQQGEFIWKARSNGNLGLIWKGATS